MRSFPTLEPVIANGGAFVIERRLDRAGEIFVGVGDSVTPESVIGRSTDLAKPITVFVADELAVEHESLRKYLTKSVGAEISRDDVIARVRRGLRTASVRSPVNGTLVEVDEAKGTITISTAVIPQELRALVHGTIDQVIPSYGALIKASGTRIYGILGFGREAIGELVVGNDRHDREFTADRVKEDWSGKIVLAGMTLGVPAMQKLADTGVAGVIAGSIGEADIRRFVASIAGAPGLSAAAFWQPTRHGGRQFANPEYQPPFTLIVTEGFGRLPMADPIFESLRRHGDETMAISPMTIVDERLARPEMYLTSTEQGSAGRLTDEIIPERTVRVNDPSRVGQIGNAASEPFPRVGLNGLARHSALVSLPTGRTRVVPVDNIEVIS